jgi:hypothetical protein
MRDSASFARRAGRRGGRRRVAAVLAGTWLGACASAPPDAPPLADFEAAERKDDVIRFTGFAPTRCTWSRPGNELCSWRLANRNGAWWTLAPTLPTEYQLNLVCEFPSDGSRRAKPCAIYPRKSRPFTATPPVATAGSDADRSYRASAPEGDGDLAREEAQGSLDAARTVREIVELVGDAPELCVSVGERSQECVWNAGNQTLGYELLAATIDTDERIQLHCTFPEDGSPRAAGSCRIDAP